MKTLLYLCAGISAIIGLYELTWIGRSSLAIIVLLAFIVAVNSYAIARKEKE